MAILENNERVMKNKYEHIEKALRDGYKIHGFRSGGGLRVLSMEKKGEKKTFYGESCNLNDALRILNDDIKAGGREYSKVYGKKETHYLTGSYAREDDPLDAWVCGGNKFDVHFENNAFVDSGQLMFVIDMSTEEDINTPKMILERVWKKFETVYWKVPGQTRIFKSSPTRFADNSVGCSTATIPSRSGKEANDERIHVRRISKGESFEIALKVATEKVKEKQAFEWFELSPGAEEIYLNEQKQKQKQNEH